MSISINNKERYIYIKKNIQKFGLRPTSKRELSLFALSCIALGYAKSLKDVNSSLKSIAAIGGHGEFFTLMNENDIGESVRKFLENNSIELGKLLSALPAKVIFKQIEGEFEELPKNNLSFDATIKSLEKITYFYPEYMRSIGIYNCFWRYLGNRKSKGRITSHWVKVISQERDTIAKLYPEIEELTKKYVNLIGKEKSFDGDLIRYFTNSEMKNYLKRQENIKNKINDLEKRRRGYFYAYFEKENREEVITDKNFINAVRRDFFSINAEKINIIKGYAVYNGLVKGVVYNLEDKNKTKPKNDFILVASMTHPKDIMIIKQSRAIITDEGGILSHAAIISRELNKPCVMGTKIATKVLKDGDLVEVDANKGIVKIIKKKKK